ncbi:hypothetical protein VNO77_26800 [Canavalia gladiata]|uniref:Uncharacterized protein n=1 Tax=Canavalia gladiata TaxID=3824 RepID=A0AAN9Q3N4_CANGL
MRFGIVQSLGKLDGRPTEHCSRKELFLFPLLAENCAVIRANGTRAPKTQRSVILSVLSLRRPLPALKKGMSSLHGAVLPGYGMRISIASTWARCHPLHVARRVRRDCR